MGKQVAVPAEQNQAGSARYLQRHLNNRHIQLISLGGCIGTGLFMGSGQTINLAGPSIIFIYLIIGFMLYFVMRAMGELLLSNLEYKSFNDFATDLLGPMAGYFTGWTYGFCWVVTGMAELVAITAYAHFWFPYMENWIISLICVLLLLSLNLVTVKIFGEAEFWFAIIKIIAIVALILTGLGMAVSDFRPPSGKLAAFSNLWHDGIFPYGLNGFLSGFQIAVFSFVGIELVGTTAAESRNPQHVLPKAINVIPIRIIMFYVLALFTIMVVTPWHQVVADKSPFVQLFVLAGLPSAAALVNFVVLTSAASSANSGIYSTSRMLYGLSKNGLAPASFAHLSCQSVPAAGILFSCLCLFAGVILLYLIPNIITVFTLITTVSAVLFMFIWTIILCSYLVYRHRYPQRHVSSGYKMPLGGIMCWICLAFLFGVLILLTLKTDTFHALMITPLWFIILAIGWRFTQHADQTNSQTSSDDRESA